MKTMSDYTMFCTSEQTKKALALGAPIETRWDYDEHAPTIPFEKEVSIEFRHYAKIPTTEEMIGWLEEQGLQFLTGVDDEDKLFFNVYHNEGYIEVRGCDSRQEATIAAIDAALEYLVENKLLK